MTDNLAMESDVSSPEVVGEYIGNVGVVIGQGDGGDFVDASDAAETTVISAISAAVLRNDIGQLSEAMSASLDINQSSLVFDHERRVWRLETPLITACRLGHLPVIQLLVNGGASLDFTDQGKGKTSFHWACTQGHVDVAAYLIEHGADVNRTDFEFETPLVEAVALGAFPLVRLLLDSDVSLESHLTYDRDTPLMFALYLNHHKLATLFLQAGSNVHTHNRDKEDPLSVALASRSDSSLTISESEVYVVSRMLLTAGHNVTDKHVHLAQQRVHAAEFGQLLVTHQAPELGSLRSLARNTIRRQMLLASRGRSILSRLERLPLPLWLLEYLTFVHH